MELSFIKTDPTGNTTILVESSVPRNRYAETAAALMRRENLCAEQVGFIEEPERGARARLCMMGGEFCGNAAMSLAAFIAHRDGVSDMIVPLEMSGVSGIITCGVKQTNGGTVYSGSVEMPPPEHIGRAGLPLGGTVAHLVGVKLPGITHIIVPVRMFKTMELAKEAVNLVAGKWIDLVRSDALGIILFDAKTCYIEPLVCVKGSGTATWEHGCASGAAAIAYYISSSEGCGASLRVRQPGGVIDADATYENGSVKKVTVRGKVRIVARGVTYI
ncbi:histidine racemase CntK [Synergistales bacterium]|nr:histidine racemase CntK [Synergistales bacterium]